MKREAYPAPTLEIYLFGAPEVQLNGTPIKGLPAKTQALLFYLAITQQAHQRLALATLLWSETSEKNARASLRKALQQLQTALPDHLNLAQQLVMLKDDGRVWVDVLHCEHQLDQPFDEANRDKLEAAIALYRGDFLAGFLVRHAPDFEAWQMAQQTRFREMMLDALQTLSRDQQAKNELEPAIATTRRMLELEPWREEAHRQLMRLLVETGQRTAALHQYEICRQALWEEMAVEPSDATKSLYQRLKSASNPKSNLVRPHFMTTVDYKLVGREAEWASLQTRWQKLTEPHFIAISGEPGIGKTRLAEEMLMLAEQEGCPVARTRSHALEGRLAYGPIADWLRTDSLKSTLSQLDAIWLTEIARILPELRIEHPNLPQPEPLKDSWQRKQFFEALTQPFIQHPNRLLLVLDDLQWCDSDTLEWLHYLLEEVHTPILVIGTVRAEELEADHPWPHIRSRLQRQDRATDISLTYLTPTATQSLAAQMVDKPLTDRLADHLFADTGGNPLFVIEHMRAASQNTALIEVTTPAIAQSNGPAQLIPPKIYNVIQARLHRLSAEAAQVAEMGATIGRAFDVDLLSHTLDASSETILTALDECWQQRIIREVDSIRFDFSHDRIRDVAYAEISPIKRRLLHRQVAQALEITYSTNLEAISSQLAVHFEVAGLPEQALTYYQLAADGAKQLFAHQEARHWHQQALQVLHQLPKNKPNLQTEVDLMCKLAKDIENVNGVGDQLGQPHRLCKQRRIREN